MNKSAIFSPDRKYRYLLTRNWGDGRVLAFVCLNPSVANENYDDPTVRRCIAFARTWGYATVRIENLYAMVTTDPNLLSDTVEVIGPGNDAFLNNLANECDKLVVAWGNYGVLNGRGALVANTLTSFKDVYCFSVTKRGQPKHPLYVKIAPESTLSIYRPFRGTRV